ncbi:hypothetical protein FNV43_RR07330 [Rhamnella rubrinervis]|uniref:Uncharacterized protein n=1 Tax=Rhamnella rubrinervis TaxID=2594499 RepID=A0A8K0MMV3_9ROSA|nr:hypothetical protein FNV43_RR07330 [Rhamnella rubrinervis]
MSGVLIQPNVSIPSTRCGWNATYMRPPCGTIPMMTPHEDMDDDEYDIGYGTQRQIRFQGKKTSLTIEDSHEEESGRHADKDSHYGKGGCKDMAKMDAM